MNDKIMPYDEFKKRVRGSAALKIEEINEDIYADVNMLPKMFIEMNRMWQSMFEIAEEKYNAGLQQRIIELESENRCLKNKCDRMRSVLKQSIPMHTILYLLINMGVIVTTIVLLILCYTMHVYVFDPYYLICALLIGVTLFSTALKSLFDWRTMLGEHTKEK